MCICMCMCIYCCITIFKAPAVVYRLFSRRAPSAYARKGLLLPPVDDAMGLFSHVTESRPARSIGFHRSLASVRQVTFTRQCERIFCLCETLSCGTSHSIDDHAYIHCKPLLNFGSTRCGTLYGAQQPRTFSRPCERVCVRTCMCMSLHLYMCVDL